MPVRPQPPPANPFSKPLIQGGKSGGNFAGFLGPTNKGPNTIVTEIITKLIR